MLGTAQLGTTASLSPALFPRRLTIWLTCVISCSRPARVRRPFWLSPRQVAILPVSEKYLDYAEKVRVAFPGCCPCALRGAVCVVPWSCWRAGGLESPLLHLPLAPLLRLPRSPLLVLHPVLTASRLCGPTTQVRAAFHAGGFHVDLDQSDEQLGKKIAMAQVGQYNFILVVGKVNTLALPCLVLLYLCLALIALLALSASVCDGCRFCACAAALRSLPCVSASDSSSP